MVTTRSTACPLATCPDVLYSAPKIDSLMPRQDPMFVLRHLFVLTVCGGLPAAELVIRDVGVAVGVAPSSFTYDLTNAAGSRSGDDSLDTNIQLEGHGRYSLAGTGESWGIVVGGGLGLERAAYASGGSWLATEVRGLAGVGWAMNDRLTLLGEAELGLGFGTLQIDGGSAFPGTRFSGRLVSPGARVVALMTLTEQWYTSLSVGWRQTRGSFTGDGTDLSLTMSGFTAAVGFEWRLSARPALLE